MFVSLTQVIPPKNGWAHLCHISYTFCLIEQTSAKNLLCTESTLTKIIKPWPLDSKNIINSGATAKTCHNDTSHNDTSTYI